MWLNSCVQNGTNTEVILIGKDVAVAERAVAEEQRQRIDLLQNYSEETCSRVHLPGGVYFQTFRKFKFSDFVQVLAQANPLVQPPVVLLGYPSPE